MKQAAKIKSCRGLVQGCLIEYALDQPQIAIGLHISQRDASTLNAHECKIGGVLRGGGDLYNLREGGWKMNAHNGIIRYSQGFKRVAVCLGGRPRWGLKPSPQAGGNPSPTAPEWPRVCGVTRIFPIFTPCPSPPPSHVRVLTAEQGRGGAERQIAS